MRPQDCTLTAGHFAKPGPMSSRCLWRLAHDFAGPGVAEGSRLIPGVAGG